jgi:hypothetical protein
METPKIVITNLLCAFWQGRNRLVAMPTGVIPENDEGVYPGSLQTQASFRDDMLYLSQRGSAFETM